MLFYAYNYSCNHTFALFCLVNFQLHLRPVKEFKLKSGNLVLILECKRIKYKKKENRGKAQRATACHHRDAKHFHVRVFY